ncbi:uncharacterized protein YceK [Methylobacterium sp. PvP062]|uniref:hypothetical protein n=2 Tax=Methylobacteriaceae TaxID=119045 RepID=UPI001AE5BCB5|nr:hypothetical protein [Methylobacterium sp. PvP105]MBP2505471.1 uncharacterized protein YceK [Methylobacterium sp. PvP109]MCX7336338.1 hypothetical protein [Hyphomicrobiales bacterium]
MMMQRLSSIVALTIVTSFCGSITARAATEEQKQAAIENLAMISMAKKWCTDYQIDQESTVAAALSVVDLTQEPYTSKFKEQRATAEKMVGQYGTTTFCLAAFKTYGPERGMNLMMKK